MRTGKRLLCLGALVSILCTNVAFGEEFIPPNPLSGSTAWLPGGANPGQQPGPGQQTGAGQQPGPGGTAGTGQQTGAGAAGTGQQAGAGTAGTGQQAGAGTAGTGQQTGAGTAGAGQQQDIALPVVEAEGAVLLDCATGQILFEKNAHNQFYPASITKVMTALLTVENCALSDVVTFSEAATTNLESGAVTISLAKGDQLTVEQCLYALLLKSANEVANGLAEHMAGSVEAFADMMNARAASLGCTGTHFANPNGLNNSTHLTTPYDMALIARAAYANPVLSKISTTTSYQMPATQKSGAKVITMGHKMLYPTDSRYYPGMVGGKTGYTSKAKNTLVTCVERDGVRLVAVVMKAEGSHYTDTRSMLDYGFALAAAGKPQKKPGGAGAEESQGGAGQPAAPEAPSPYGQGTSPGNAEERGWGKDAQGWYYVKADGRKVAAEWLTLEGKEYWIEGNAYMATGWKKFPGEKWCYFGTSGALAKNTWVTSSGKWYYVGPDGVMLASTTTPDGYPVGSDGAWIQ